jgi:hypothetical protein
MASYIEKIIGFTSWVSSLETTPSPSIKTKKSSTSAPVNTMTPTPRTTETGTQVQVSTPKTKSNPKPISVTTSTIETQTIENPQLLAYTDEQLIEHYTTEIFQCQPGDIAVAAVAATAPVDATHTCCVCLDTLELGNTNTTLTPCGHAYHLSCLLSSLRNKNLCPMCRGSLEEPRPVPTTTNILRPANAEQIIRDELYWFPKSSYIQNIRGSNHPRRAFKEAARTFAYSVLQSAAEFVHADNVPEEWYSEDDTEDESDDSNSENENTDNDNENTDNEDDTPRNQRQQDEDEFNYAEQLRIQAINEERTRGANHHPIRNIRLRSRLAEERGSNFDLRDELP